MKIPKGLSMQSLIIILQNCSIVTTFFQQRQEYLYSLNLPNCENSCNFYILHIEERKTILCIYCALGKEIKSCTNLAHIVLCIGERSTISCIYCTLGKEVPGDPKKVLLFDKSLNNGLLFYCLNIFRF